VGSKWGLSPKAAHWLYTSVIRPIISYAAIIWSPALEKKTTIAKLDTLQRSACAMITGAIRSTPGAALNVMLSLNPIKDFLKKEALLGFSRLTNQGYWINPLKIITRKISHRQLCEKALLLNPEIGMPNDKTTVQITFPQRFATQIGDRTELTKCTGTQRNNKINCWTDGSKIDSGYTGSGVLIISENLGDKSWFTSLGKHTTVFQAETHAILNCVNYLSGMKVINETIEINTDSQACIKALAQYKLT
jgi:hypothetical protein